MKPIIKYQGGKTRELPIIKKLAPTEFNRIIEPFAGGAAVSFAYENLQYYVTSMMQYSIYT